METTNFEHLKNIPNLYRSFVNTEKAWLEVWCPDRPNIDKMISVMAQMRSNLDQFISYMIEAMGLTEAQIRSGARAEFSDWNTRTLNYPMKSAALVSYGAMSQETAKLERTARKIANSAAHYYDVPAPTNNILLGQPAREILQKGEDLYQALYSLSYLLVYDFIPRYERGELNGAKRGTVGKREVTPEASVQADKTMLVVGGMLGFICVLPSLICIGFGDEVGAAGAFSAALGVVFLIMVSSSIDAPIVQKNQSMNGMAEAAEHNPKSKATAALLCFFLGGFGAHFFYVGRKVAGLVRCAVYLGGVILFRIAYRDFYWVCVVDQQVDKMVVIRFYSVFLIMGGVIWTIFFEFISILRGKFYDKNGQFIK